MKNLLIIAFITFAGFQSWEKYSNKPEPLFDEPYVAVYGRNTCSITKRMLKGLEAAGIEYEYYIVDEREVAKDLHERMEGSGLSTTSYGLPVVDVNGDLTVRPDLDDVISDFL